MSVKETLEFTLRASQYQLYQFLEKISNLLRPFTSIIFFVHVSNEEISINESY